MAYTATMKKPCKRCEGMYQPKGRHQKICPKCQKPKRVYPNKAKDLNTSKY